MYQLDIVLKKGNNLAIRDRTGRSSIYSSHYLSSIEVYVERQGEQLYKSGPPNESFLALVSVYLPHLFWHCTQDAAMHEATLLLHLRSLCNPKGNIYASFCQFNIFLGTFSPLFLPLFFQLIYFSLSPALSLSWCRVLLNHTHLVLTALSLFHVWVEGFWNYQKWCSTSFPVHLGIKWTQPGLFLEVTLDAKTVHNPVVLYCVIWVTHSVKSFSLLPSAKIQTMK